MFLAALLLYPTLSDATFAIWDPAAHSWFMQESISRGLSAHHLLFHFFATGLYWVFDFLHLEFAAQLSFRVLSAFSAGLIVFLVVRLAGPNHGIGLLFALVLLAGRLFIIETVSGENVLLGSAAALGVILAASRAEPNLRRVGALLVLALLLRQDNILVVPGVLTAAALSLNRRRVRRLACLLAVTGAVTIACYLAVGFGLMVTDFDSFGKWLVNISIDPATGTIGSFKNGGGLSLASAGTHLAALGIAVTGLQSTHQGLHILIGVAYVGAILLAAILLRANGPGRAFAAGVAVTLGVRLPFYIWFEPVNSEWWLLPLVLLCALGARMSRGARDLSALRRALGAGLLLATAALALWPHGRLTWKLRERTLWNVVQQAIDVGGRDARYVCGNDLRVQIGLGIAGIHRPLIPLPPEECIALFAESAGGIQGPVLLVLDRFIGYRVPLIARTGRGWPGAAPSVLGAYSEIAISESTHNALARLDETADRMPGVRAFRRQGRVVILAANLP